MHVIIRRINPSSVRPGRLGFTLIELLVVVAIIGLLIAIMIPSLMMAQEAANELICKTNLDQIYKGIFVFVEDNEEDRLPFMGFAKYRWVAQVSNAIGYVEPDLYKCPSEPDTKVWLPIFFKGTSFFIYDDLPKDAERKGVPVPVTYRGFCDQADDTASVEMGRRLTDFKHPSEEFLLVEGWISAAAPKCMRMSRLFKLSSPNAKNTYKFYHTWERHSGTTNILFVDGHVDRLTPYQIGKQAWHQEWGGMRSNQ